MKSIWKEIETVGHSAYSAARMRTRRRMIVAVTLIPTFTSTVAARRELDRLRRHPNATKGLPMLRELARIVEPHSTT